MSSEAPLALIARLQDSIHEVLKEYIPHGPMALLDFPDIRNVGDSAIWLGEIAYLKNRFAKAPDYVSTIRSFSPSALERIVPEGPIFIHGGGNFGDIWPGHQRFREAIIERWPDRPIIQLPQSIHFSSEEAAARVARLIDRHKNFVLLVRDEESKHFAEKNFDCVVKLCPDMAFCIGPVAPVLEVRYPVLAMLREDKEKAGSHDMSRYPDVPVEDWITESTAGIRLVKAMAALRRIHTFDQERIRRDVFDAAAAARFQRGLRQLSRARAVVTDRLHVHIISLLLGKPHAVLDNHYGKIRRFMAAFSTGTDLTYQGTSLEDAIEWARRQA